MKRNNPLNIRYNPNNDWLGQVSVDNGFCVFTSEFCGMRAALIVLLSYRKQGFECLEDIIYRWAPPSENPTQRYVNFVENYFNDLGFGIHYDVPFLCESNIHVLTLHLSVLLCAMETFENGSSEHTLFDWYKFLNSPKIQKLIQQRL